MEIVIPSGKVTTTFFIGGGGDRLGIAALDVEFLRVERRVVPLRHFRCTSKAGRAAGRARGRLQLDLRFEAEAWIIATRGDDPRLGAFGRGEQIWVRVRSWRGCRYDARSALARHRQQRLDRSRAGRSQLEDAFAGSVKPQVIVGRIGGNAPHREFGVTDRRDVRRVGNRGLDRVSLGGIERGIDVPVDHPDVEAEIGWDALGRDHVVDGDAGERPRREGAESVALVAVVEVEVHDPDLGIGRAAGRVVDVDAEGLEVLRPTLRGRLGVTDDAARKHVDDVADVLFGRRPSDR